MGRGQGRARRSGAVPPRPDLARRAPRNSLLGAAAQPSSCAPLMKWGKAFLDKACSKRVASLQIIAVSLHDCVRFYVFFVVHLESKYIEIKSDFTFADVD